MIFISLKGPIMINKAVYFKLKMLAHIYYLKLISKIKSISTSLKKNLRLL